MLNDNHNLLFRHFSTYTAENVFNTVVSEDNIQQNLNVNTNSMIPTPFFRYLGVAN